MGLTQGKGSRKSYELEGKVNVPIVKVEKEVVSKGKYKSHNAGKRVKITEFVGNIEQENGDVVKFKLNEVRKPIKTQNGKFDIHYFLEVIELRKL